MAERPNRAHLCSSGDRGGGIVTPSSRRPPRRCRFVVLCWKHDSDLGRTRPAERGSRQFAGSLRTRCPVSSSGASVLRQARGAPSSSAHSTELQLPAGPVLALPGCVTRLTAEDCYDVAVIVIPPRAFCLSVTRTLSGGSSSTSAMSAFVVPTPPSLCVAAVGASARGESVRLELQD